MADDAITLRVRRGENGCIGVFDFPTFQTSGGKMVRADMFSALPIQEAVVRVLKLQPLTPYTEVVVKLDSDVVWRREWGTLI